MQMGVVSKPLSLSQGLQVVYTIIAKYFHAPEIENRGGWIFFFVLSVILSEPLTLLTTFEQ